MRFSRYNILTRKLNTGDHIILNSLTGVMDLIDEEAYGLISAHAEDKELAPEVLKKMESVQDHFRERGYLTGLSAEGELAAAQEYADKIAEEIHAKGDEAYILVPSLSCNYRCPYCFERETGYPSMTMNKKQVDAVFSIMKDKLKPGYSITLYGGEPLARENREIIQYIVERGMETGNVFYAVTNGHDLDHYIDLLGSKKINVLQVTLDGPAEIHNKRRISISGVSSYDTILKNIKIALRETDVLFKLRINLDRQNAPYILDLLEDLKQQGILDDPAVSIAVSPVGGAGESTITYEAMLGLGKLVSEKYPELKDLFISRLVSSDEEILPALIFKEPVRRRVTVCSASEGTKIFCPDGNIYSCWSCIGNSEHVIGTFKEDGSLEWNRDTLKAWKQTMLAFNKECLKCKYSFLCAGGCYWQRMTSETPEFIHDCFFYRNIFESHLAETVEKYMAARQE